MCFCSSDLEKLLIQLVEDAHYCGVLCDPVTSTDVINEKEADTSSIGHRVTPRCYILGCQRWSRLEIFEWFLVMVKTPWSVMAPVMPSKCASTRRVREQQGQRDELNEVRGMREECLYYVTDPNSCCAPCMLWARWMLKLLIWVLIESTSFTATTQTFAWVLWLYTSCIAFKMWFKVKADFESCFVQVLQHISIGPLVAPSVSFVQPPGELPLEQPVGSRNGISRCLRSRHLSSLVQPANILRKPEQNLLEGWKEAQNSPDFLDSGDAEHSELNIQNEGFADEQYLYAPITVQCIPM